MISVLRIVIAVCILSIFTVWGCGNSAKHTDEVSFDYCRIIRKIQVVPSHLDPDTDEAQQIDKKIWLLNICFPEDDTVSNRASIDISVEEDYPVIVEFDTIQSFPDAKSARQYADENRIIDVRL